MIQDLFIPAFVAGILTFLAPCTLPLVPGYLGFISGVSSGDLTHPAKKRTARLKIFLNGLLYVLGFSAVFVLLGSLVAFGGSFLSEYRFILARAGGVFIIIFGLFMVGLIRLPMFRFLQEEKHFSFVQFLRPGNPISSMIFGATFAFGWTPCVGPVLGSILTLAATTHTVFEGAFLLGVFASGLALPFLIIALGIGSAAERLEKMTPYLNIISIIGGALIVLLGILLVTNQFGFVVVSVYQFFDFLQYDLLLQYL